MALKNFLKFHLILIDQQLLRRRIEIGDVLALSVQEPAVVGAIPANIARMLKTDDSGLSHIGLHVGSFHSSGGVTIIGHRGLWKRQGTDNE